MEINNSHQGIVIETIARNRKVLKLAKLNKDTIHIGRAYDNDFIITEPHIDAHHAKLQNIEGRWYLIDCNSTNGTRYYNGQPIEKAHLVQSGEEFTLGKTHLRLVQTNHPVAATQTLGALENWIHHIGHPFTVALLAFIVVAASVFMEWLQNPQQMNISSMVTYVVVILSVALVWPLFFAGLSKIFKHDARIFSQMGISFVFLLLFFSWAYSSQVVRFNISQEWFSAAITYFIHFWLLAGILWFNLYIGFNHRKVMRWSISAGLAFIVVALELLSSLNTDPRFEQMSKLAYNADLMPPALQWQDPIDIDTYLKQSSKLFEQVQHKAARSQAGPDHSPDPGSEPDPEPESHQ